MLNAVHRDTEKVQAFRATERTLEPDIAGQPTGVHGFFRKPVKQTAIKVQYRVLITVSMISCPPISMRRDILLSGISPTCYT